MFGSSILDTAIGLMFFYFLLSTICATVTEWLAGIMRWRASTLEQGIKQLLTGAGDLADRLYAHPLVKGLSPKGRPSYIPSATFATALLDVLGAGEPGTEGLGALRERAAALPQGPGRDALLALLDQARGDLQAARQVLANWFDDAMDRVSGWYKRRTQRSVLLISLIVTVAVNGDTLVLANALWRDATLRESVTATMREAGRSFHLSTAEVQREIEKLHPPLGWRSPYLPARGPGDPPAGPPWYRDAFVLGWLAAKILGLLLTTIAVSLGAPFWFDLLNRVSNVRSVGQRPERSRGVAL